jgi:hypothetical protein
MIFFAHAGHDHNAPAVDPTPTAITPEPVLSEQPYPSATPDPAMTNSLPPDAFIGGATLLALVVFLLLATYIFKLKLATRLSITMALLLVVGMLGYQTAPVTSIVALTAGIAMALGIVLVQLGTKAANKPKA